MKLTLRTAALRALVEWTMTHRGNRANREGIWTSTNITSQIINSAIKVHTRLGAGSLESVYEEVLHYELVKKGVYCERQVVLPVFYDEIKMEVGFKMDLVAEKKVAVEIKSVETVNPFFKKKLLNHLRLANLQIGLLINFNEEWLKNGITRLFNKSAT